MVKITGQKRHSKRLKAMSGQKMIQNVGRAIFAGSDEVRVEAQHLISQGSVQGRNHVPSRPGEPPNWDTGVLAGGITNRKTGAVSAETESSAPYSLPLEIGSAKMAERPFMRPAAKNKRRRIELLVGSAVNIVIRRG
ncbi:hypothetical protein [Marinicauda sp. Alg238-R41]|uniref:hypothetical protein n=1 Tax=Marinicauda sp. Alg238-R41 TaxID=2993447 RepID=UPI0022E25B02|nr:hypothetical protein [Marinicauda sp. Alg238-R41]